MGHVIIVGRVIFRVASVVIQLLELISCEIVFLREQEPVNWKVPFCVLRTGMVLSPSLRRLVQTFRQGGSWFFFSANDVTKVAFPHLPFFFFLTGEDWLEERCIPLAGVYH